MRPKSTLITDPAKLYSITDCPEFISQTVADDNNNYTMNWCVNGDYYHTKHNLLNL